MGFDVRAMAGWEWYLAGGPAARSARHTPACHQCGGWRDRAGPGRLAGQRRHAQPRPVLAATAAGSFRLEPQRRWHCGHREGRAGTRERARGGLYQSVPRLDGPRNLATAERQVIDHAEPQLELRLRVAPRDQGRACKLARSCALRAMRLPQGEVREVTWLGWQRRSCASAVCTLQTSTELQPRGLAASALPAWFAPMPANDGCISTQQGPPVAVTELDATTALTPWAKPPLAPCCGGDAHLERSSHAALEGGGVLGDVDDKGKQAAAACGSGKVDNRTRA